MKKQRKRLKNIDPDEALERFAQMNHREKMAKKIKGKNKQDD